VVAKDRFKQKGADAKMMAGFEVLGKYYVDKGMTINFHKGFQDLNPKYLEKRHQRATKLATNGWKKLKTQLQIKCKKKHGRTLIIGSEMAISLLWASCVNSIHNGKTTI